MAYGSGGGATITFSTLGTFAFRAVGELRAQAPQVDGTHLTTQSTYKTRSYLIPDIMDMEPFEAEVLFDTAVGLPASLGAANRVTDTITITYKKGSGEATNATLAGAGWVQMITYPRLEMNAENIARISIQFENEPTFTVAT